MIKVVYRAAGDDRVEFKIVAQSDYSGMKDFTARNGVVIASDLYPEWLTANKLFICGRDTARSNGTIIVPTRDWRRIAAALRELPAREGEVQTWAFNPSEWDGVLCCESPATGIDIVKGSDSDSDSHFKMGDYVRYTGRTYDRKLGLSPGAVYRVSHLVYTKRLALHGANHKAYDQDMFVPLPLPTATNKLYAAMWDYWKANQQHLAWCEFAGIEPSVTSYTHRIVLMPSPEHATCKVCDGEGKIRWRGSQYNCLNPNCRSGQAPTGHRLPRWRVQGYICGTDPSNSFTSDSAARREAAKRNETLRKAGR